MATLQMCADPLSQQSHTPSVYLHSVPLHLPNGVHPCLTEGNKKIGDAGATELFRGLEVNTALVELDMTSMPITLHHHPATWKPSPEAWNTVNVLPAVACCSVMHAGMVVAEGTGWAC